MTLRERVKGTNDLTGTEADDLTTVLLRLLEGAKAAVGDEFVGAYLTGSFSRGAGDAHSDVDFIVVTDGELGAAAQRSVRELHALLPTAQGESGWPRHLEGSYVSRAALRRDESDGRGWLYVDNGSRVMEWSAHDNTAVARSVLHDHGVPLEGPHPHTLLDEVRPERLVREALSGAGQLAQEAREERAQLDNAWALTHCVTAMCRYLFTAATGRVTSKADAGEWAIERLGPRWAGVIRRALDDRPDPWLRVRRRSDPAAVAPARAFLLAGPALADELRGPDPAAAPAPLDGPGTDVSDPRELLLGYLDWYREALTRKTAGLSDDLLRAPVEPLGWSPLGLVQHLGWVERRWMRWGFAAEDVAAHPPGGDDAEWRVPVDRPTTDVLAAYADEVRRSRALADRAASLAEPSRVGGRFATPEQAPALGRILFHLLQEYARHVGQLDVARELIDGRTGE